MKTAILSMQRIVNYGSVLQAYSLREMVRDVTGTCADFLEIEDTPALASTRSVTEAQDCTAPATYPSGLLQRGKRWIIVRLSAHTKRLIRSFMEKELGMDRDTVNRSYDHVIIGSDEVFNHAKGVRLQLHGQVRQAAQVCTYAASCGSAVAGDIAAENVDRIRQAMSRLSVVSVRDEGTARYVAHFSDAPVERHMDPVLVGPLAQRKPRKVWLKHYLLVYAYGQRIRTAEEIDAIRAFARKNGLKIVAMGGSQFWCDLYVPATPFRMLDWFAHADYVVTDTFHGTIFSVINRRKFATIVRKTNRNKLTSLLADLELAERQISDMAQLPQVLAWEIDYEAVDALLSRERERAMVYLKEQLGDEQGTSGTGR